MPIRRYFVFFHFLLLPAVDIGLKNLTFDRRLFDKNIPVQILPNFYMKHSQTHNRAIAIQADYHPAGSARPASESVLQSALISVFASLGLSVVGVSILLIIDLIIGIL